MKIDNYNLWILLGILLAIIFIGIFYLNKSSSEVKTLDSIEIREYNGTRLDSVHDFRENSIKGIQYINISEYRLVIDGLVESPKTYSYEEVLSHQSYKKVVTLNCVEGWSATILWEGILINELFTEAKPLPDAKTIIFHAYDGYTVNYPVEYFKNKNILLAYKMNNATLIPDRGFPFVLVAEDKWGYKWIKWITEIEFSDDVDYKGYWESRGYSKEGNLNESFYSQN